MNNSLPRRNSAENGEVAAPPVARSVRARPWNHTASVVAATAINTDRPNARDVAFLKRKPPQTKLADTVPDRIFGNIPFRIFPKISIQFFLAIGFPANAGFVGLNRVCGERRNAATVAEPLKQPRAKWQ
jgi:hypothetical protein